MGKFYTDDIAVSPRIHQLIEKLYEKMPEIEADRAVLLTESYKQTEGMPVITRRAEAFVHILSHIPITIRENELIVGSAAKAPRGCQVFPEFSYAWLEEELDTVESRSADPFFISEPTKARLREIFPYWRGKTTSELASAYMDPEARQAIEHNIFTPGNYFYNGVGHVTVCYDRILKEGYRGIIGQAQEQLDSLNPGDSHYAEKSAFLRAVMKSCTAACDYAKRYARLAHEMAEECTDPVRKSELKQIAQICMRVPENPAETFYEALQSFWFVQMLLQIESSGHSISPGRFDQYMFPYYRADLEKGILTRESAQELIDCVWVKLNDLNKVRDQDSAQGFAGYSLFQNLIVGGQDCEGNDAVNDVSFHCIRACMHTRLPQPSFSARIWNGTPHEFMIACAKLTRIGIGLPAYYNDEVIIPSLMSRGLSIQDARDYNIIGCVEPQKAAKTEGWHDAAFFNMCRPLELVFSNGMDKGQQISVKTGNIEQLQTFDAFYEAYKKQMNYMIELMVNAINAIDIAHAERAPLPFLSAMVEDCIGRGKSVQEGGAVYNFTGPQGFGIANVTDALFAVRKLVYEEKKLTLTELCQALNDNFGTGLSETEAEQAVKQVAENIHRAGKTVTDEQIQEIYQSLITGTPEEAEQSVYGPLLAEINRLPKYGNDIREVDEFAREVAYTYTRPLEQYKNPRGGQFQGGLYPVSANVPLGMQTGATPDGRLAHTPIADGVSPASGRDTNGPTAAANSVSRLDHYIASNGTLFNQKFHPSALAGDSGLEAFTALVRAYFDQKGSHMQFNVVSRETLLDAQKHPENYKTLVVRVAGYSALFTSLSKSLQNDIINRTEQGF